MKNNLSKSPKPITQVEEVTKPQSEKKPRVPGAWTGQVTINDDFNDMPAGLMEYFK